MLHQKAVYESRWCRCKCLQKGLDNFIIAIERAFQATVHDKDPGKVTRMPSFAFYAKLRESDPIQRSKAPSMGSVNNNEAWNTHSLT